MDSPVSGLGSGCCRLRPREKKEQVREGGGCHLRQAEQAGPVDIQEVVSSVKLGGAGQVESGQ